MVRLRTKRWEAMMQKWREETMTENNKLRLDKEMILKSLRNNGNYFIFFEAHFSYSFCEAFRKPFFICGYNHCENFGSNESEEF